MQVPTVRFWLAREGWDIEDVKKTLAPKFNVVIDPQSGRGFVQFNVDPLDPTAPLPELLGTREGVKEVTCRVLVNDNFSQEGIYRNHGVTLQVKTVVEVHGLGDGSRVFICQQFNFSGPSIEAIRTVYTNVRQGILKPQEPWVGHKGEPHEDQIARAIKLAVKYGGIDEAHHKAWVIDQMVRVLAGDQYKEVVRQAKAGDDGPETYAWDTGIAP